MLWWLGDDRRLSSAARAAIANPDTRVYVSAASVWEISIKRSLGKLRAPDDLLEQISVHGFDALPISLDHAYLAGSLPPHHDDPFDRMLIAQATAEGLQLVTSDGRFDPYQVPLLRT